MAEYPVASLPAWLHFKHATRGLLSQVFDDEVSYDAAYKAGWRSSPEAFGIETHPSQPTFAAATTAEPLPSASPMSVDLSEVTAIMLSMQARQETTTAMLADLAERMQVLEREHHAMRRQPAGAHAAGVAHPTEAVTPPDDEPPHVRQRRP